MTAFILKMYDYLKSHKAICVVSGLVITLALVLQALTLSYKEDISDFLPLDAKRQNALKVYQNISGADKIFAIFQYEDSTQTDPDVITEAISHFANDLEQRDSTGMVRNLTTTVDIESMKGISDFVYDNIPYFLSDNELDMLDSLAANPALVRERIAQDKDMLMFPVGGLLSDNIGRDPLNVFTPVVAKLQSSVSGIDYEMYDGYIFSPDMSRGIAMLTTPFGSSETENNTRLLALLKTSAQATAEQFKGIDIHLIGAPVIAVGNANQIKQDSILSVSISVVFILLLLFFAFRRFKNIALIFLSIAWGWLFAIGGLSLVHNNVSVIIIGMSSVIIGIAVNYPLHLISHLNHTPVMRNAIKEIIMPLVIGNITTVGAFLALVPLDSVALRDLGLFSSFLLIGTIVFVLLYLPHMVRVGGKTLRLPVIDKIGELSPESKPWIVWGVVVLTVVFGYFSLQTSFDSNMAHINYMTGEQKKDMEYFQKMLANNSSDETLYVISSSASLDEALQNSQQLQPYLDKLTDDGKIIKRKTCADFIVSTQEQERRLGRWKEFVEQNAATLTAVIADESAKAGFAPDSFNDFQAILKKDYSAQSIGFFAPLTETAFAGNVSLDTLNSSYSIVDVLSVPKVQLHDVEEDINADNQDVFCFDLTSLNSTIADSLSDDFNYIGFVCGFIVFFFLWFSLGRIELALLSFLPMAVSWIWILGIMGILGIQFNIVNVILATFIFGQGDDYTIFMTEGASYEYAYRKKMLASYKHSIILSALIMFIGIGSLIIAKHPALHSLAEVTIVGMFSVVFMAYTIPPLIFRWLVYDKDGQPRVRPVTLRSLFTMGYCALVFFIELLFMLALGFFLFKLTKPTARKRMLFHNVVHRLFRLDMNNIWGVRYNVENPYGWDFTTPRIVICNHQSMIDSACLMAMSPRVILMANKKVSSNPVISQIFKWLDFQIIQDSNSIDKDKLRRLAAEGYSIVVFPEGERNANSSILRFHKGAFALAVELNLDILPIIMHGINDVLPRNSFCVHTGMLTIRIEKTVEVADASYQELTRSMHKFYCQRYAEMKQEKETPEYFANLLLDRYRYKGTEIEAKAKHVLKHFESHPFPMAPSFGNVVMLNAGIGAYGILYALVHPEANVCICSKDEEEACIATYSAEFLNNITVKKQDLSEITKEEDTLYYAINPSEEDKEELRRSGVVYEEIDLR